MGQRRATPRLAWHPPGTAHTGHAHGIIRWSSERATEVQLTWFMILAMPTSAILAVPSLRPGREGGGEAVNFSFSQFQFWILAVPSLRPGREGRVGAIHRPHLR